MAEFNFDNLTEINTNMNATTESPFYGNRNTQKISSPKIVDVGIDLLANKNMRRDASIGSADAVTFDMPVEDLNLNDSINLNLYDMLQNNNSNNTSIPTNNFTFKQPSPEKTYGRNPVQTNTTLGADTATDANLNVDGMAFTFDNIDNPILDPFDASKPNVNADGSASFDANGEPKKDIDDLDKMDVDELLSECSTLKEKHGINTPAHFNRRTPTDEIRAFIRRERRKREKNNAEKLGAKILLTIITSLEFLNNKFDFDNLIEEAAQTRYFNNVCCNECDADIFDEPRSYFFDLNKLCDQHEGDEQLFLLKESLKLKDWNGENLYLIANRGFLIFSDDGLEDISTLTNRLLSEDDFSDASYYSGGKVKQDVIYKIKEVTDEIISSICR